MSESNDPSDQPRYIYKPSLLGSPHEFALTPTALDWVAGRMHAHIPYANIRKIRLSFRPVTMQHYRFIAEIWTDRSPKLTISSTSWRGVVEQERFDSAYTDFVIALHQRLVASGNLPKLERGAMPLLYWPGLVVFFVIGAGMLGLLAKAAMEHSLGALAVVAGFFLIYVWQLGGFFWRNRPGQYQADAIPAEILPRRKA